MDMNQQLRSKPMTKRVWARNVDYEMIQLNETLKRYPVIALDTEYPGIIHQTRKNSSDDECYNAMKANVESTKLIQCGLTLFDVNGNIGGTWEINFSNFGDPSDARNESSINFLMINGLDFKNIRKYGVDMFNYRFFQKLLTLFNFHKHVQFVTFQGAYDFAYVLCILNNGKLPETRGEFAVEVTKLFGDVYDVKVMAGFCEGIDENFGLSRLAHKLRIERVGKAHNAGSDSLMTALVYMKLRQVYENSKLAKGMLYRIGKANLEQPTSPVSPNLMRQQNLVSYPTSNLTVNNGYVQNYDDLSPIIVCDYSGVPWIFFNPSSTFTYQYQSQAPYATDFPEPVPNYYNSNAGFLA